MVRIEENQRKIEEMGAFRDDPKIDKIIRALQKQIAQFLSAQFVARFPNPKMLPAFGA